MERGEAAVVRYSPSDDDSVFGLGSGCGGEIVVLLEPMNESTMRQMRDQLSAPNAFNKSVITIHCATEARLLGTRIESGGAAPTGALVQPITRPLSLVLFGASPAAAPMTKMAKELGWKITIADHRPSVQKDERFAGADAIVVAPVDELPKRMSWTVPSAAVVMTHHYRRDLELLHELLPRKLVYLGAVGSRGRAERLIADLLALGIEKEDVSRLRAPAGLDLGRPGARSPRRPHRLHEEARDL